MSTADTSGDHHGDTGRGLPAQGRSTRQRSAVAGGGDAVDDIRRAPDPPDRRKQPGAWGGLTGDREVIYRRSSTPRHHHHLVCRECGKTVEVEGPAVVESWAARVAAEHGYSDVSHTLEIFGTCGDH